VIFTDFKSVKTTNYKLLAKQENESSHPAFQHQTAQGRQLEQRSDHSPPSTISGYRKLRQRFVIRRLSAGFDSI
jgi:hypothetical protein